MENCTASLMMGIESADEDCRLVPILTYIALTSSFPLASLCAAARSVRVDSAGISFNGGSGQHRREESCCQVVLSQSRHTVVLRRWPLRLPDPATRFMAASLALPRREDSRITFQRG